MLVAESGAMRSRFILACLPLAPALAAAGPRAAVSPAPAPPPADAAVAPPPSSGPPSSGPPSSGPPPSIPPFDPIDQDGWPRGLSVGDLRALPDCTPGQLTHTPGAPVTCRPPIIAGAPQWGLGVDWTSGATFGDVATEGGAHALGVDLDFALSRSLELGARYELLGVATPPGATAGGSTALSNQVLGQVAFRLWSDEVERDAWKLGVGAGYAFRDAALGGSAPLVRASLAREIGSYLGTTSAMTAAVELAYERSLGAQQLSAVLASLRLGFETHIRPPADLGQPAPAGWRHTASFDVLAGPFLGLGVSLGLRATRALSLETSASYLFGFTSDAKEHGFDTASWAVATGPRVQLPTSDTFPLYLQAQGGAAWVSGSTGGQLHPIATGELGVRGLIGCASAFDLGVWGRGDLDGGQDYAGGLVLRLVIGTGRGAAGGIPGACTHATPRLATAPRPPPPPPHANPERTLRVDLSPPRVAVPATRANAGARVVVTPPRPIVIDVELGATIGPIAVTIDPRLLPIARLREAVRIDVALSGPAAVLPRYRAQLAATLGRSGIHVAGWTQIPSDAPVVRARFTIQLAR